MGRPKEFEPEEALEKAMHQFWAKGYHDTSIRDLVERTGVNYYGLYGEFENKRGLFLAALDRYRDTVTAEILRALKRPGPAVPVIRRAFEMMRDLTHTADGRVGCMMCNTAVELAPYDEDVAAKVRAHTKLLRDAFRAKLAEGQEAGEVAEHQDISALAEFLSTTVYSGALLARSGYSDAYVTRHIRTALSVLG